MNDKRLAAMTTLSGMHEGSLLCAAITALCVQHSVKATPRWCTLKVRQPDLDGQPSVSPQRTVVSGARRVVMQSRS
jgi:hypothetical protein